MSEKLDHMKAQKEKAEQKLRHDQHQEKMLEHRMPERTRRARTPEHLMGKVMACAFTPSMCAQPAAQMVYGVLFDWFVQSPQWVLLPSGLLVCGIGLASVSFFRHLEQD